eukprot:768795-Hanusia_phi.AAC.6
MGGDQEISPGFLHPGMIAAEVTHHLRAIDLLLSVLPQAYLLSYTLPSLPLTPLPSSHSVTAIKSRCLADIMACAT